MKPTLSDEQFSKLTSELIKVAENEQEKWEEILIHIPITKETFEQIINDEFDNALNEIYNELELYEYAITSEQLGTALEIFKDYGNIFEDFFLEEKRLNKNKKQIQKK